MYFKKQVAKLEWQFAKKYAMVSMLYTNISSYYKMLMYYVKCTNVEAINIEQITQTGHQHFQKVQLK
jgi:uncharacterized membrane protein